MNERIRQLADQCREEYPDTEWPDAVRYRFNEAKFAELIVRECVNCCDEVDRLNKAFIQCYDFDPQNGPEECIQAIKEHFGVEE